MFLNRVWHRESCLLFFPPKSVLMATAGAECNSTVNPLPEPENQVKGGIPLRRLPQRRKRWKGESWGRGMEGEGNGTLTRVTFEASLRRETARHRRQRLQGAQSSLNPRLLELRSPEGINQVQSHSFAGERGCRLDPTNTEPEPRHWETAMANPRRALCLLITPNNVMKCNQKPRREGLPERRESCIFAHQPVLPKNHKVTTASRFHSPCTPWPEIPSRRTVSSHTRPYTKSIFVNMNISSPGARSGTFWRPAASRAPTRASAERVPGNRSRKREAPLRPSFPGGGRKPERRPHPTLMHARTHRHTHTHTTQYPDTLPRTPHSHRAPGKIADTEEEQGRAGKRSRRRRVLQGAGSSLRSGGGALGQRRVRARAGCAEAVRAWRRQPRAGKWPLTRGTEQGLPRLGSPLQSNSRRSPEERQAAAAAAGPQSRSPSPAVLPSPFHQLPLQRQSCYTIQARIAEQGEEEEKEGGRGGVGLGGTGVGRKGREEGEEGGEGPAGRRVCVWSSLRHQPQLPPLPPPLFSKIALSAPPARRGSQARRNSGSRKQSPGTATCQRGEKAKQRPDRTHVYACLPTGTARPRRLPRCPRQVEGMGAVGTGGSLGREPQKGFPACANVVLASGGERESSCLRRTPAAWPPLRPQLRRRCPGWAAERRGSTPAGIPWVCAKCAPRRRKEDGGGRSRERAAELPQAAGEAVCGHVVRYVLRARAAGAAGRRQSRVRGSVAFPPAPPLPPPQLCLPVSAQEFISMDSAERLREGRRHPASTFPLFPHLPDLRGRECRSYHC